MWEALIPATVGALGGLLGGGGSDEESTTSSSRTTSATPQPWAPGAMQTALTGYGDLYKKAGGMTPGIGANAQQYWDTLAKQYNTAGGTPQELQSQKYWSDVLNQQQGYYFPQADYDQARQDIISAFPASQRGIEGQLSELDSTYGKSNIVASDLIDKYMQNRASMLGNLDVQMAQARQGANLAQGQLQGQAAGALPNVIDPGQIMQFLTGPDSVKWTQALQQIAAMGAPLQGIQQIGTAGYAYPYRTEETGVSNTETEKSGNNDWLLNQMLPALAGGAAGLFGGIGGSTGGMATGNYGAGLSGGLFGGTSTSGGGSYLDLPTNFSNFNFMGYK